MLFDISSFSGAHTTQNEQEYHRICYPTRGKLSRKWLFPLAKPGIGEVELFSAGQEINATVHFEYASRGETLNSRFLRKEQEGLRVVPSTFITSNQLKVSRIGKIFGDSLSSILVQALP